MKKRSFSLVIIFVLLISVFIYLNNKNRYLPTDDIIGVYVNNELNSKIPSKGSAMFQKAVCDNTSTKVTWDNDAWGLLISNLNKKVKCNLYFYSGKTVFDYDYTGDSQEFIAPVSGIYKVELWGAQGGDSTNLLGGLGGYVSGNIKLEEIKKLYIYVGGRGVTNGNFGQEVPENHEELSYGFSEGGYNGGGSSGNQSIYNGSGGGATDIRIVNGNWNDFNSLKSRIMVAGGGGGSSKYHSYNCQGGVGGGLIGGNGIAIKEPESRYAGGGEQISSGYAYQVYVAGGFGRGGEGNVPSSSWVLKVNGGGGSGYYGGSGGGDYGAGGAGGSSFISGHNGCDAIKEESTENNIIHTGQSIHYSGLYFTNTLMIDGEGYRWTDKKEEQIGMPSHSDNSTITGNTGNGYARITLISIDE